MTDTATKQCPFCAETILAQAVVCKHCGRELNRPAPVVPTGPSDRQLIEQEVAKYAGQGYRVVSQTETAAQVAKPKKWNAAGIILFVLLPLIGWLLWSPLIYVVILGVILVVADYALKKEELVYISAAPLRPKAAGAPGHPHVVRLRDSSFCSACDKGVRPDATACKHCGATFA